MISTEIIVSVISLLGTIGGSFGGILVSSKLTNYRIEQLEKKVEKHNNFGEKIPVIQEQITELRNDVNELKAERK